MAGRQMVATALGALVASIYFVGCEAIRGATTGKSACRIVHDRWAGTDVVDRD